MAVLADSNPHALISEVTSYYRFNVEIHSELPRSVTVSMCEIVEGVVRHRDFVFTFINGDAIHYSACSGTSQVIDERGVSLSV